MIDQSKPFWLKARRAADTAELLYDNGSWDAAIDRSYFPKLQATRAAFPDVVVDYAATDDDPDELRRCVAKLVEAGLPDSSGEELIRMYDARYAAIFELLSADVWEAHAALGIMTRYLQARGVKMAETPP